MLNKVILQGRMVKDIDISYGQGENPTAFGKFTLAITRNFKNKDNEYDTDFIDCKTFGKTAEFMEKWIKKGKMVNVEGEVRKDVWEDKEKGPQSRTYVNVSGVRFSENSSEPATIAGEVQPAQSNSNDGFYPINETVEDDDLPF